MDGWILSESTSVHVDLATLVLEAHTELEASIADQEMDDLDLQRGVVFHEGEAAAVDPHDLPIQTGLLREVACQLSGERLHDHTDLNPIKELQEVITGDDMLR